MHTKLTDFLSESYKTLVLDGKEFSRQAFLDYIHEFNPDYDPATATMYKGVSSLNMYGLVLLDPTRSDRSMPANSLIYTKLMRLIPSMKDVPDRARSVIFTNNEANAHHYGQVYNVIPKAGARIAAYWDWDMWSDRKFDDRIGFDTLMFMLRNAVSNEQMKRGVVSARISDDTVEAVENGMTVGWLMDHNEVFETRVGDVDRDMTVLDFMDAKFGGTVTVTDIKGVPKSDGEERSESNELWTDSPCLLLPDSIFLSIF